MDLVQYKEVVEAKAKEKFEIFKKEQMNGLAGATPTMLVDYLKRSNLELKDKVLSLQSKVVSNKFVTIGDIDVGDDKVAGG